MSWPGGAGAGDRPKRGARRRLAQALALLTVALLLAATWQEMRYQRTRREIVGDRQALFHSPSALHVATLLALASDRKLRPSVRHFAEATEEAGGHVVYAGQIAGTALTSSQLPREEWDAFVLAQFATPEAYEQAASAPAYLAARASFAHSYAMGMRRSPWVNLAIPVAMLGLRAADWLTFQPTRYPFEPVEDPGALEPQQRARRASLVAALQAHREQGKDAVVILNFIKQGDPAQRAANARYSRAMLRLMAEVGNGPMHIGRAVTLEGDADFDGVAVVYYPGVDYFTELLESRYFTEIIGGKQLADSFSSPSVPLLPHL